MKTSEKGTDRFRYLIKNTGLLTLSNFSSKILVFLLVPLYTSVLSTREYGSFDLVQTTIMLLLPVLTVNIYDAVMRFCMDDAYDDEVVCGIGIKYVVISILTFTFLALVNYKLDIVKSLAEYTWFMIIFYIASVCNQFLTQYAKGREEVKTIAIAGVANTGSTLLLNIVLLLKLKWGIEGFFIAYITGQLLSGLIIIIKTRFWEAYTFRKDPILEREMLSFSVPLILGSLGWWCNNASDRYVITMMCGLAANGIYSVAYKIPSILTTVQQIFMQAWQISAIKDYGKEDTEEFYGNIFKAINIAMCAVCMLIIIATKPIAHILFAKDFYQAWQYVPFLLVAGVFNSASGVLGPVLSAGRDSKSLGVSALIGTIANLLLNFILIYFLGPQGAAIATAASSYLIYRLRKNAVKGMVVFFDYIKDVVSWLIIIIQAICEIYFSNYYIEIMLIVVFVLINYPQLKKYLNSIIGFAKRR